MSIAKAPLPTQDSTTQQARTNNNAMKRIRAHNPTVRKIKTHAPNRAATVTVEKAVPTSKKTHCLSITKTTSLMLFRQITAVYSDNHTKPINTL
jgi:hypothetical protein